jgi:hypothetical protein
LVAPPAGRPRDASISKRASGVAAVGTHDDAVVEERVGNAHGRLQDAAGIAAQVEHEPAHGGRRAAADEFQERRVEISGGRIAELRDPHITIAHRAALPNARCARALPNAAT